MYISEETRKRLIKFLYRELEIDNSNVEINELLDELENRGEENETTN